MDKTTYGIMLGCFIGCALYHGVTYAFGGATAQFALDRIIATTLAYGVLMAGTLAQQKWSRQTTLAR